LKQKIKYLTLLKKRTPITPKKIKKPKKKKVVQSRFMGKKQNALLI
jgi:hypothetical protein